MSDRNMRALVARGGIGERVFTLTTSDSTNFAVRPAFIYVTVGGVIQFVNDDATVVAMTVAAGYHPLSPVRINATSTTASGILGII